MLFQSDLSQVLLQDCVGSELQVIIPMRITEVAVICTPQTASRHPNHTSPHTHDYLHSVQHIKCLIFLNPTLNKFIP
jgi:hypothetical protein